MRLRGSRRAAPRSSPEGRSSSSRRREAPSRRMTRCYEPRRPHPDRCRPQRRDRHLRDRLRIGNGARIFRLRLRADLHAAGQQHGGAATGRGRPADHRFHRGIAADSECVEAGRPQGHLGHGVRRPDRRADRNLLPEPARSGDDALDHLRLRVRAAVAAAVRLALSRQGPCGDFDRHRRPVRLLQRAGANRRAADRRLLARPADRLGDRARQHPAVLRGFRLLLGGELFADRADHVGRHPVFAAGRPGLCRRRPDRRPAVRPRQRDPVPQRSATP